MLALVIFSAFLLFLSFPSPFFLMGIHGLAWIFAVPLFFAIQKKSLFHRIFIGILFGIVFYSFLVFWLGDYSPAGFWIFVFFLTIQPLFFCIGYSFCFHNKIAEILYVPSLWVVSEHFRTMMMGGFSWGISHSQSFNIYAIQVANLLGTSCVSFVLIFVNYCIYKAIQEKKERRFYVLSMAVVLSGVFVYGVWNIFQYQQSLEKKKSVLLGSVQPNIDFYKKLHEEYVDEVVDRQILLTAQVLTQHNPDLIVWPETAIPFDFSGEEKTCRKMDELFQRVKTPFLLGSVVSQGGENYNSALFYNREGKLLGTYSKNQLIPFSEYMPHSKVGILFSDFFKIKRFDFSRGEKKEIFLLKNQRILKGIPFGVLICSEDMTGKFFREYALLGADFMIVLLNDGWLKKGEAYLLHAQNTIMHAVENKMPILRAANTGWTILIDAVGRPSEKRVHHFNEAKVFLHKLIPRMKTSIYSRIGNVFSLMCSCFVIINWMLSLNLRKKNEK